jgi:nicotinate-nucleotide adenylyltransferase
LAIADQVRTALELDRVLFIPTGDPPHKPSGTLAPAAARLEMVRLAVQPHRSFAVSDVEVRRPGKSYTIETVQRLEREHGPDAELHFLIGLDAFIELPTWRQSEELLRRCRFAVIGRPGSRFVSLAGQGWLPAMPPDRLAHLDANEGRLDIQWVSGKGLILLHLPPCDASASDIRRRLRRRESVSHLLPAQVQSYIIDAKLYQEEADPTGG